MAGFAGNKGTFLVGPMWSVPIATPSKCGVAMLWQNVDDVLDYVFLAVLTAACIVHNGLRLSPCRMEIKRKDSHE
ncbi:hypothetical protein GGTG_08432 [Gaeumannomyces tritici R3-111a-1]|uniref:Uncharacterized protein n=1 Tax=Gaeumannomyces tritici (strain R3-111a-1) TaxID=644352 RepID=J3P4J5_GAET3|nr:hypothetical protein GGTG_08432 [Gaeumannomyces tritici R3-111a-1]EJT74592.1 hypothetical protein GGTG_08432 [Gaeumannomyces tritici R3-111a-1]